MLTVMTMKVLGGKNLPPYWARFDRLQRTADKLRGGVRHPKGVFRFKSFEEFETWKQNLLLTSQDCPKKPTS